MATLSRHWRETVLGVTLCTLILGGFAWHTTSPATAQEGADPIPLDRADYDDLLLTLTDVSLDRDALVALNLGPDQALQVLHAARMWWEQQGEVLRNQRVTIAEREHAVRLIEQAMAMGPAHDEHGTALASARADLAAARTAYDTTLSGLRQAVASTLSESQQTTYTALATGLAHDMPLRMIALSSQQRVPVSRAWRHYRLQRTAARSAEDQAAALAAWDAAQNELLTADQRAIVESYYDNYATAAEAVADAMEATIPLQDS